MKNLSKSDLIEAVSNKCCDTKKQADDCVNGILEIITSSLSKGDKITITGFGTFSTSKRAARMGVNPRTGEKIKIKATIVPKFKAGKSLKDAVRP
ncbi:MAG: HU family DNA-binding protein [Candidatus Portnoybacteria bacterium]|nr:HU family DNA-binding protein [Candidatus Portnoybacteria bacterium]